MPKHTPAERKKSKAPSFGLKDIVRAMGGMSREAVDDIRKRKKRDKEFRKQL